MMRVGIIGLLQESNSFIAESTTLEMFEQVTLLTGQAIVQQMGRVHHEIGGFIEGLEQKNIETVPIFAARALPYGVLTAETHASLLEIMFDELAGAGRLDGLLVAPHGATVSEPHPDVDGHWLTRVRNHVGPDVLIIGTLDPHANLSRRMVDACDALCAYRTNPHLDQRQRGLEAASLMLRTLCGEARPTMAATMPPIAINIERQLTSEPPCRPLYELAEQMLERPGVLSTSIILGFPYADVEEMGSATLVVTDSDVTLARELADQLATDLWTHRHDFAGRYIDIEEAVDRAVELDGPVCLLDMGDNIGGGSPGDGTYLAHAMHRRQMGNCFICFFDPESVQQAEAAGLGNRVHLQVGGKTDDRHGGPLEATFTLMSLHDGHFEETRPRHGGQTVMDQGRTAIVRTDFGMTVMLTALRMTPFSLCQLSSCELDPASFHILVAKGVHAPVAAYEEVCRHLIRVNTPGVTCADMTELDYRHRRKPMFPFEPKTVWDRALE